MNFAGLSPAARVAGGGRCMYFSSTSRLAPESIESSESVDVCRAKGAKQETKQHNEMKRVGMPNPRDFEKAHLENITTCTRHLCACITHNHTSIIYIHTLLYTVYLYVQIYT